MMRVTLGPTGSTDIDISDESKATVTNTVQMGREHAVEEYGGRKERFNNFQYTCERDAST